ncbi:XRE family transcriptional regulator [Nostoc linckia z18]|uniref:XRE family transcriptional regulator n=2 Tax=Nostoc linckia TaxID=92942 RepID=A0A9Q5ZBE1_NOSLI|nr:helix-turn-helix transcriptional regulator [Nostoc linckia]PHK41233.1 XRE family transcriptional regulator [Nostoc linckia z15]PHK45197.1 XRE family transcriptional regulator [Nostoc linckia z16]PHJ62438.1 XRE family transcriptional regulator [Nostoc linckia z1]PHJ62512.1 XRE family transcriptional regulator [Nostoc linckia z3]PHJ71271.1 XRE family transcriptional regulator [Nostoc linckia z2]
MIIRKPLAINQPEVGQLLREMRLLAGLTQEQFAINLNVRYSTINRWENGHYKPSPLAMEKIEGILESMGSKGESLLAKYLLN